MKKTSGGVVIVRDRPRPRTVSTPLALRIRVAFTRRRLDREIASQWPCHLTPSLALRARQLVDPRNRKRIARTLRGTVARADRMGTGPNFSAVVLEPGAVMAGRQAMLGLAERLDGSAPVCPRGMVLAHTFLTDGGVSPLFNRHCAQTVTEAIWDLADALEAEPRTVEFDALAG